MAVRTIENGESKERVEIHVSVALLLSGDPARANNLLCVRDKEDGGWGVPAGKLEMETPEQAVRREFAEETGLKRSISRLYPLVERTITIVRDARVSIGMVFQGQMDTGDRLMLTGDEFVPESEECDLVRIMNFEEVARLCTDPYGNLHRPEYSLPMFYYWMVKHMNNCLESEMLQKLDLFEELNLDTDLLNVVNLEGFTLDLRGKTNDEIKGLIRLNKLFDLAN